MISNEDAKEGLAKVVAEEKNVINAHLHIKL